MSFSTYGLSSVAWNTLWICFHVLGILRRYINSPKTSLILNGPSLFGDIFLLYFVDRFLESIHTFCSFLNGSNFNWVLAIILLLVSSWAASTSFQYQIRLLRCSSTVGKLVCSNEIEIAMGLNPIMSSKGILSISVSLVVMSEFQYWQHFKPIFQMCDAIYR